MFIRISACILAVVVTIGASGCATGALNVTDVTIVPQGKTLVFKAAEAPSALLGVDLNLGDYEIPDIVERIVGDWNLVDGQWYLIRGFKLADTDVTNLTIRVVK